MNTDSSNHRVDRVPGFFSSRPNWDLLHPHPQVSVFPPLVPGGHTRLRERGKVGGGVPIPTMGQTLWYSRWWYFIALMYISERGVPALQF